MNRRQFLLAAFAAGCAEKAYGIDPRKLKVSHFCPEDDDDSEPPSPKFAACPHDNSVTIGYERLERTNPHFKLAALRQSVGGLTILHSKACSAVPTYETYISSAVLIDPWGTLALCAHQVKNVLADFEAHFSFGHNNLRVFPASTLAYDESHDIAFAQLHYRDKGGLHRMTPAAMKAFGLRPVGWARAESTPFKKGLPCVLVGFPADASPCLHAVAGATHAFDESINYTDHTVGYCKIESSKFEDFDLGGTSGGGFFNRGNLIGINSAGIDFVKEGKSVSYFTPASLILEAYAHLFPERYQHSGLNTVRKDLDQSKRPGVCRYDAKQFVILPS